MNDRLGLSVGRSLLLLVIGTVLAGISGLLAILICHYLLNFGGADSANKHGLSQIESTRIGGVMIAAYLGLNLGFQGLSLGTNAVNHTTAAILLGSLPFFLVGLFEDWYGLLSARFRFLTMLGFAGATLLIWPEFRLLPVGIGFIDGWLLRNTVLAGAFTALCLGFLPNAFNTADGANGLVSGVAFTVTLALAGVAPSELQGFLYSIAIACALFLIYNLATGRFFLGDGGAYLLGAIVGFCLIVVSNSGGVSVWYLLALIFYPVADLLFSMARRVMSGRSPFAADNEHLHNLVFAFLSRPGVYPRQANTLTGVGIAIVFCGIPFALFQWVGLKSTSEWICGYMVLWMLYLSSWRVLSRRVCVIQPKSGL
ncbi:Undecaprenyl-phosphate N-acetylglucosaminyl 1-phosphate transferase [Aequoribacter fuscus]|uniref:Undecaprenyl-phosphate N-acetylglucosaminyl 1-phosphate transferase n=1 Tax=Aequoribacter fuscus TaxID=2518989 RepID=F3L0E4_9GAMM|nr:MraY family glycosyltransferase [Aequoribacter fuscus]EGG30162.1 Undecaprenyl-phosphate N-acetylglucosaminyl 1-phosphate transferase [Aequoribacter fuscus]QHJ88906.1 undecaprenyl/decaprenyl-phosphate alpha-N-acetylglucosaminyl 1-phosphate transferase [Aequoribacter fuscus]